MQTIKYPIQSSIYLLSDNVKFLFKIFKFIQFISRSPYSDAGNSLNVNS